jgi:rare lipoprotein A
MMKWNTVALGAFFSLVCPDWPALAAAVPQHASELGRPKAQDHRHATTHISGARSGHVQKGQASVYDARLRGRRMADGTRFDPASDVVASKTLPLGSTARVTNLTNGKAVKVKVRDRGPYVRGRIVDVSPKVAKALGMKQDSIVPVAVAAIAGTQVRGR